MKFATALLALATAAFASPIESPSALEARCSSCAYHHETSGYGRYEGEKKFCERWVPVDESGIAIDVDVDVCLNVDINLLGLIKIDLNLFLDVNIDIDLLHTYYPTCSRLVCDPTYSCHKGQKIPEDKCWTHEFDEEKYNRYY